MGHAWLVKVDSDILEWAFLECQSLKWTGVVQNLKGLVDCFALDFRIVGKVSLNSQVLWSNILLELCAQVDSHGRIVVCDGLCFSVDLSPIHTDVVDKFPAQLVILLRERYYIERLKLDHSQWFKDGVILHKGQVLGFYLDKVVVVTWIPQSQIEKFRAGYLNQIPDCAINAYRVVGLVFTLD